MEDYLLGNDDRAHYQAYDGETEGSQASEESEGTQRLREKAERKAERKRRKLQEAEAEQEEEDEEAENAEEKVAAPRDDPADAEAQANKSEKRSKTVVTSFAPPSPPPTDGKSETSDNKYRASKVKHKSGMKTNSPDGPGPSSMGIIHQRKRKRSSEVPSGSQYGGHTLEEVRTFAKDPAWKNTFLSSRWLKIAKLKELEDAGALSYRRGKWTTAEESNVKKYLKGFQMMHSLSDEELINVIMSKKDKDSLADDPMKFEKFWPELAAEVPGRPVKYVKDHVQRRYHPHGHKGAWTESEDRLLRRAHKIHPDQWEKIARSVERTETDCRDRWRDTLRDAATKNRGKWTLNEESQLVSIVKEVNMLQGREELAGECDWEVVRTKMGGARTRLQIRKKWQDDLRYRASQTGSHIWGPYQKFRLVQSLSDSIIKSEADIDWPSIASQGWTDANPKALTAHWERLKSKINPPSTMPFTELLEQLIKLYPEPRGRKSPQSSQTPSTAPKKAKKRRPETEMREARSKSHISNSEDEDEVDDEKKNDGGAEKSSLSDNEGDEIGIGSVSVRDDEQGDEDGSLGEGKEEDEGVDDDGADQDSAPGSDNSE